MMRLTCGFAAGDEDEPSLLGMLGKRVSAIGFARLGLGKRVSAIGFARLGYGTALTECGAVPGRT